MNGRCLGDYAALKDAALRQLAKAAADDAEARADMMKFAGIALYYGAPADPAGALGQFEGVLAEYDKNPAAVGKMAVTAVNWGVTISLEQKDETRARAFMKRLPALPACATKDRLLTDYKNLTE